MTVQDDAWFGHGVMTVNNLYPPGEPPWDSLEIGPGAVIGTNATLLPVEIGENSTVGAGAVVVEDVPPNTTVVGNPARPIEE
jgi:acetyltransferase-like isoleucine patch superfamily enzyme